MVPIACNDVMGRGKNGRMGGGGGGGAFEGAKQEPKQECDTLVSA